MQKTLIICLPVLLSVAAMNVSAEYIPYEKKAVQKLTPEQYDKNHDSYITADEVETELREDAVDKAIAMQKSGASQAEIDHVIEDMEDSIEQDAEVLIDLMDKDGDELVEPEEH